MFNSFVYVSIRDVTGAMFPVSSAVVYPLQLFMPFSFSVQLTSLISTNVGVAAPPNVTYAVRRVRFNCTSHSATIIFTFNTPYPFGIDPMNMETPYGTISPVILDQLNCGVRGAFCTQIVAFTINLPVTTNTLAIIAKSGYMVICEDPNGCNIGSMFLNVNFLTVPSCS